MNPINRFVLCVIVLSLLLCAAVNAKYENVKRLQVGVKFRPETCDRAIKDGDNIDVHYRGTLVDGTEFDSSYSRNQPFTFTVCLNYINN